MARINDSPLARGVFFVSVLCWIPICIAFLKLLDFKNEHVRVETISREFVASNIFVATQDFLRNYAPAETGVSAAPPDVFFEPGLCLWSDVRGRMYCRMEECDYTVGDYCKYGRIVDIGEARLYCVVSNEIRIVRRGKSADAGSAESLGSARRPRGRSDETSETL